MFRQFSSESEEEDPTESIPLEELRQMLQNFLQTCDDCIDYKEMNKDFETKPEDEELTKELLKKYKDTKMLEAVTKMAMFHRKIESDTNALLKEQENQKSSVDELTLVWQDAHLDNSSQAANTKVKPYLWS